MATREDKLDRGASNLRAMLEGKDLERFVDQLCEQLRQNSVWTPDQIEDLRRRILQPDGDQAGDL
jgi:hypothetical protein